MPVTAAAPSPIFANCRRLIPLGLFFGLSGSLSLSVILALSPLYLNSVSKGNVIVWRSSKFGRHGIIIKVCETCRERIAFPLGTANRRAAQDPAAVLFARTKIPGNMWILSENQYRASRRFCHRNAKPDT